MIPANKTIKLRPHHIVSLANKFFRNEGMDPEEQKEYGLRFLKSTEKLLQRLIKDPKQKIQIVPGLDDICNHKKPRCGKKVRECFSTGEFDSLCLREYGLEIDKVYETDEILRIIQVYKERTNHFNPIEKVYSKI